MVVRSVQIYSPGSVDERPLVSSSLPPRREFSYIPGNLIIDCSWRRFPEGACTYLVEKLKEGDRVGRRTFPVVET
jgi:NAD(P)H-flavin reductase